MIEHAVRDIPCFILCSHYTVLFGKDEDFDDNEEKMKVEMIRRLNRMLEKKKFYLEPAAGRDPLTQEFRLGPDRLAHQNKDQVKHDGPWIPFKVIEHNPFQRLESGLPNEQEKVEWKMHWLEPSFHCVFFYWRHGEVHQLLGKILMKEPT